MNSSPKICQRSDFNAEASLNHTAAINVEDLNDQAAIRVLPYGPRSEPRITLPAVSSALAWAEQSNRAAMITGTRDRGRSA